MKILIVDDIVVNRYIIKEIVKKLGHDYLEAENGKLALDLLRGNKVDLVFLDIEMPVMNGIETAHCIRNEFKEPLKSIKIFAITAYNPSILHEELNMQDFDGVVTKPYSIDKILHIIESLNIP